MTIPAGAYTGARVAQTERRHWDNMPSTENITQALAQDAIVLPRLRPGQPLGIGIVDFFSADSHDALTFGNPYVAPVSHGHMVEDNAVLGLPPQRIQVVRVTEGEHPTLSFKNAAHRNRSSSEFATPLYPAQTQTSDNVVDGLEKMLKEVRAGNVQVVVLSRSAVENQRLLARSMNAFFNTEVYKANNVLAPENRQKLRKYIQQKMPLENKAIELLTAMKKAGGIVVNAAGNYPARPDGKHVNLLALADPFMVAANDENFTTAESDIAAPSHYQVAPMFDAHGSFTGIDYDNDRLPDTVLDDRVKDAIQPYVGKPVDTVVMTPQEASQWQAGGFAGSNGDDKLVPVAWLKTQPKAGALPKHLPQNAFLTAHDATSILQGRLNDTLYAETNVPLYLEEKNGRVVFQPNIQTTTFRGGGTSTSAPRIANQIIRLMLERSLER